MNIYDSKSLGQSKASASERELSLVERKRLQWSKERADQSEWFPFGKEHNKCQNKQKAPVNNNRTTFADCPSDICDDSGHSTKEDRNINGCSGKFIPNNALNLMLTPTQQAHHPVGVMQVQFSQPVNGGPTLISTTSDFVPSSHVVPVFINNSNGYHYNQMAGGLSKEQMIFSSPPAMNHTVAVAINSQRPQYDNSCVDSMVFFAAAANGTVPNNANAACIKYANNNYQNDCYRTASAGESLNENVEHECAPYNYNRHTMKGATSHYQIPKHYEEYTEQWANQLSHWQAVDQNGTNNYSRPEHVLSTSSPAGHNLALTYRSSDDHAAAPCLPSSFSPASVVLPPNSSTPVRSHHHPAANNASSFNFGTPMAYVSPLIYNDVQKTAALVTSSQYSDGSSSIKGHDGADVMSTSFTGGAAHPTKINVSDELFELRQSGITSHSPEDPTEKQKILGNKAAIERQILERQRIKALELERDRLDQERSEHERRLIELKESLENKQELNKWKEMQEEEERRKAIVQEALDKARIEAERERKEKLYKHVKASRTSAASPNADATDSGLSTTTTTSVTNPLLVSTLSSDSTNRLSFGNSNTNLTSHYSNGAVDFVASPQPLSSPPYSDLKSDDALPATAENGQQHSRSQSLPPNRVANANCPRVANVSYCNPADDRPIKPMTEVSMEEWKQLEDPLGVEHGAEHQRKEGKKKKLKSRKTAADKLPPRKSRSTSTAKVEGDRRAGSLEKTIDASATSKNNAKSSVTKSKTVQEQLDAICKEVTLDGQAPKDQKEEMVESRLSSAATYVIKRDTVPSQTKSSDSENLKTNQCAFSPLTINGRHATFIKSAADPTVESICDSGGLKNGAPHSRTLKKSSSNKCISLSSAAEQASSTTTGQKSDKPTALAKSANTKSEVKFFQDNAQSFAAADKRPVPPDEVPNPWGDQFGGLNPLLHRLSTRKKVRQIQLQQHAASLLGSNLSPQPTKALSLSSSIPPTQNVNVNFEKVSSLSSDKDELPPAAKCDKVLTTVTRKAPASDLKDDSHNSNNLKHSAALGGNVENDAASGVSAAGDNALRQKVSTRRKTVVVAAAAARRSPSPAGCKVTENKQMPTTRSDIASRPTSNKDAQSVKFSQCKDDFNVKFSKASKESLSGSDAFDSENCAFKGPAYRSFAIRSKQSNEKQYEVLKQLSSLKEQLKKSQKVVEDSIRTKTAAAKTSNGNSTASNASLNKD